MVRTSTDLEHPLVGCRITTMLKTEGHGNWRSCDRDIGTEAQ